MFSLKYILEKGGELVNPMNLHPEDEHLILYKGGQLKYYLPKTCPEDILLCVLADLEDEFGLTVKLYARENPG